jgi:hypothetical protein
VPVVKKEEKFSNLEDLYRYCKTLPISKEGFVVTFENGLKVKIKADEYVKVHRMISHLTPLAYWEAWDYTKQRIPKEFLEQIPEEYREFSDALVAVIDRIHKDVFNKYMIEYNELLSEYPERPNAKVFQERVGQKYPKDFSGIMGIFNKRETKVWRGIHMRVRPTANILPEGMVLPERIARIQGDLS